MARQAADPEVQPGRYACLQVSMINRMIKIMWPTLTKAILDTVLVEVKKQLEKQVFSNPKVQGLNNSSLLVCARTAPGLQAPVAARHAHTAAILPPDSM